MHSIKVTATDLPEESLLHDRVSSSDFLDCYCVASNLSPRQAAEIITNFPEWARFLLIIRRLLTSPIGLSNDGPPANDKVGVFPVESETSRELVAGFNHRHLNFRVSVLSQNNKVFLATWVHPHNVGGKLYLKTILSFHILIARDALRRVHLYATKPLANVQWRKPSSPGNRSELL